MVWPGAGITRSPVVPSHFYTPHMNVTAHSAGHCCCLASTTLHLLRPWAPSSAPPANMDEYSLFKFLVVRLPYSLIFWQFWVLFVLRLVVILVIVVQGGEVRPPMPPS